MASRSYANLLELAGGLLDIPHTPRTIPRIMTVPGVISDLDVYGRCDGDSDVSSSGCRERKIIVANMLPLQAKRDIDTAKWCFSLDEDSILLQLKDGFSSDTEVIYVGSLKVDIDASEQEEVAQKLLEDFNCIPTFLPHDLQKKFYLGFCKQQLWPLFHYMLPMCPDHGDRFDRLLWQAYVSANKIFADKVMEIINPDDDFVWVHDYHLMVLPTFLRKRYNRVKLGFFLHSPFPSSEIYRTLPVRDGILRGLLNSDLIGFHTFDYARHFLSCCKRMLGLDYESKRGHIGLDYFGRTIFIKILPVGIHMGRLESVLNLQSTSAKLKEIQEEFKGRKVILGVDDMDIFKGISLKLLAVEQLLQQNPDLQGKVVLVQIVNPARGSGKDVHEAKKETYLIAGRINDTYGSNHYRPVILIDRPVPRFEKSAYYAVAECCIVNAVRDGMNLVPYKYIVCREGTAQLDKALIRKSDSPRTSMLVVSEFIGCSPSLSGAIRVNPWNIDAVADALYSAITMQDSEKQLRHEKHYRYISSHDVAYWARSFIQDLERACKDHYIKRCWGMGLGLGFRVVSLSPCFRKLSVDHIVSAYKRTSRRAIFLDYDGTIVPKSSINKTPSSEVISVLNDLSNDTKNTVFIVSGRGRNSLSDWFTSCKMIGLAAEHGYFLRWNKDSEWETSHLSADLDWKKIVEPVMQLYTEATDGSNIETKESALVWHHQDADPDFGSCQAKELLNHLESVLANEPAVVSRGQHIVEVKPQGISKGVVAEKILSTMVNGGNPPDFFMCVGDDISDEDMFESILRTVSCPSLPVLPDVFACTVGQKPSKAKYYLDDPADVMKLLKGLSASSNPKRRHLAQFQISFESTV
ncbi:probable alpha,alpha-trehalose-phosphate synthase [UDP-forming] 9 isoform X1 [Abrus precatorius]|uniref:alpha,alpha-trehalose-phosphate synthase (UDP-forming) n=1 Tax=Abrus precatorius TaxID=3816 RepID=A0A8B8LVW6_ABRPR|nr:probable alpha,alpha-trehalose-phosphate synthase [UDP-forming] 9 isoform X1 [Abrus precatorius]XP_027359679.1 probable alpha,alpha-trehalose-phosphate synthase [UDP-forming] 9 isoform X1 [Abrus precatorius]XP_027359681.1 probable alpha,alpha-trehalose-phosphate synthase [UDP-forming] 9 isoform X1 [Abrus precatorius]XP_027359682.1 probable alpha,alpha-trehalose-phosphate synthase [UDP-forming] 9 isoform X1 [Abrus precatorius]XP_027359683.1 probable alpha,alpha-trehalose-phosphate synthase [U